MSDSRRPPHLSVHALMVICATLVSTSFIVGEHIADDLDAAALTLVRFLFAVVILLPIIYKKFGFRIDFTSLCRYGLISLSLVIFFCCMFLSLRYTSVLNTSVLFTLVPSLSALYSSLIVQERLGRSVVVSLILGFFGTLWVLFRGEISLFLALQWNRGDIIFFAGCLAMGLYTPLVKRLYRGEKMEFMTFWILVTGCLWLAPLGGLKLLSIDLSTVPLQLWGWVAYLALFTTVVTFYLTQFSIPHIGPTKVMAYSYLYPALVLILEVMLGRGLPDRGVLPGILLIFISMLFLQRAD